MITPEQAFESVFEPEINDIREVEWKLDASLKSRSCNSIGEYWFSVSNCHPYVYSELMAKYKCYWDTRIESDRKGLWLVLKVPK
jgi:hypothetical protein